MRLLLAALLLGPSSSHAQVLSASLAAGEAKAPVPALSFTLPASSAFSFPAQSNALTPALVSFAPALEARVLAPAAAPVPIALVRVLPAAVKAAAPVQPVPVAAALAKFVVEPALAGALFDGMTGVKSTPAEKEEFERLAAGLYAAAPGSPDAVSATGLRMSLSRPTENPEKDSARRRLLRALLDLPRLTAEGMVRVNLRAPTGEALRKDLLAAKWKTKDGLPIADAVIVGGGPPGL
jgi:hypothetical protein